MCDQLQINHYTCPIIYPTRRAPGSGVTNNVPRYSTLGELHSTNGATCTRREYKYTTISKHGAIGASRALLARVNGLAQDSTHHLHKPDHLQRHEDNVGEIAEQVHWHRVSASADQHRHRVAPPVV